MDVQRPKRPRKRVRPNRKAQDQRIILMWIKRIGIGIMVLLLLGQAYRLVAVYQEKQHIEQQLQELKQRNEELEQEKAKLQDPKTIEGVAREELGLVKPGEVDVYKRQAKVRLCKLMQNKYNVLVLDEPTNHLDIYAKEELSRALRDFKGTIILVSHEPEFYQDWVTDIWNIEDWTTKIV